MKIIGKVAVRNIIVAVQIDALRYIRKGKFHFSHLYFNILHDNFYLINFHYSPVIFHFRFNQMLVNLNIF